MQTAYLFGNGASTRIGQEIRCLPYAGFLVFGIGATIHTRGEIRCLKYAEFSLYSIHISYQNSIFLN